MTPADQPTIDRSRRRRWIAPTMIAATLLAVPATSEAAPTTDADRIVAPARIEVLRMDCQTVQTPIDDSADAAHVVQCRWSVPTTSNAAGVRLLRIVVGQGTPRTQVFASRDLQDNSHLDAPLRPGHRYAYRLQALSTSGRVVSSSRTVTVAVPAHDVEPLRLQCLAADTADDATRTHVGCRWSLPTEAPARTLTLWRSVDGGARERVVSFDQPFASSYRDVVPAETTRVVYAVIATTGDGSIVARSRAEVVKIGDERPAIADLERAAGIDGKGSAD